MTFIISQVSQQCRYPDYILGLSRLLVLLEGIYTDEEFRKQSAFENKYDDQRSRHIHRSPTSSHRFYSQISSENCLITKYESVKFHVLPVYRGPCKIYKNIGSLKLLLRMVDTGCRRNQKKAPLKGTLLKLRTLNSSVGI